jgi:hypothetical protein
MVQLTATPAAYYRFVNWSDAVTATNNPLLLTLRTNLSVEAVFGELFTTNHPTPYWWLAAYGFTSNFESAASSVGANGLPLWQSYLAGLDPTRAESRLRLAITLENANTAMLSWNAVTGRVYTLWWGTNVAGTFRPRAGASNLVANVIRVTNAPMASGSYYLLGVQKQ